MSYDALSTCIAAYRTENSGKPRDAAGIKRRVLVGLGARQRRRLQLLRLAFPVAAVFFASVALAASKGMLPRFDDLSEWLGVGTSEGGARTLERGPARLARAAVLPSAQPVVPLVFRSDANVPPRPVSPSPVDVASLRARSVPMPPPGRDSRPDPLSVELRAYQAAHRLQFDGGDPARTLAAWDEYLGANPAGTFVAEARFNRAVCLLRLGRRAEAKSVLVPIADSSSAYGRRRARALLDAMGE